MFRSHLAGPRVLMQVHSDDAGNALGHIMMHSPVACALHDREHYQHHPCAQH